jgi:DNA-binding NarL/FixJ family response regulator
MGKKVLLADDHPILSRSIRTICSEVEDTQLEEVETCEKLIEQLKAGRYTHLILDLILADGSSLDVIDQIFQLYPQLRVLVYSSQPASLFAVPLRQKYGISYICKRHAATDTIRQLLAFVRNTSIPDPRPTPEPSPFESLTFQELKILLYLLMDWDIKQIAKKMKVAEATIRWHKSNIHTKTGTEKISQLIELARIHKL